MLVSMGYRVKIGCMLLFVYPFTARNLLFYERSFIIFEDAAKMEMAIQWFGLLSPCEVRKMMCGN